MTALRGLPLGTRGRIVAAFLCATVITAVGFALFPAPLKWPDDAWLDWLERDAPVQVMTFAVHSLVLALGILGVLSRRLVGQLLGAAWLVVHVMVFVDHVPCLYRSAVCPEYSRPFRVQIFPP